MPGSNGYSNLRPHFDESLKKLEPFHISTNNLRGEKTRSGYYDKDRGWLNPKYADELIYADYVVYSYHTPIAWHIPARLPLIPEPFWHIPTEKYSLTTTRHQTCIRAALQTIGAI